MQNLSTATHPINPKTAALDLAIVFAAITGAFAIEAALRARGVITLPDYTNGLGAVAGGALAVVALKFARGQPWSEFGFKRPRRLWTLPLWAIAIVVVFVVAQNASIIIGMRLFPGAAPPDLARYDFLYGNLPALLMLMGGIWLSASLPEELIYRGFVFDRLTRLFGTGAASTALVLLLQAAFFGAAHFHAGMAGIFLTAIMGLVWGGAYILAGRNLWPLIIGHYLTDCMGLLQLYFVKGSEIGAG